MYLCEDRFNPLLFQPHTQLLKGLKKVEGARKVKVSTVEVQQSTYTVRLYGGKYHSQRGLLAGKHFPF